MANNKERLLEKMKRLKEASTVIVTSEDRKTTIAMEAIMSASEPLVLHTGASKAAVSLFAINAALRVLDEIEMNNAYFGFIKARKTFVESLKEAMTTAEIDDKRVDTGKYSVYSDDNTYTLISINDLKFCRDRINERKWLLMDVINDIQQSAYSMFSRVGNYYVPLSQLIAAGIDNPCTLSNNGLVINVDLTVADIITEGQFMERCTSLYDAIKFNVADMVLDLN